MVEPLLDAVQSDEKVAQLFDYLVANIIGKNGWCPHQWTFVYFVCHFFQVMACLLYGWCMNVFIENYFLTYGYEVMKIVDSIVLQNIARVLSNLHRSIYIITTITIMARAPMRTQWKQSFHTL